MLFEVFKRYCRLIPCVTIAMLGAQVRFGHAPTSGFTRLPSVGPPGGGLPPGPGRNAALDHGLSPGMSPAMGGGASNMEMSRAMAARSGSGLTPGLTPGLSGSLSGLGAHQISTDVVGTTTMASSAAAYFRTGTPPPHWPHAIDAVSISHLDAHTQVKRPHCWCPYSCIWPAIVTTAVSRRLS